MESSFNLDFCYNGLTGPRDTISCDSMGDNGGRSVPTGINIDRLATPGYSKSIKMVLLK